MVLKIIILKTVLFSKKIVSWRSLKFNHMNQELKLSYTFFKNENELDELEKSLLEKAKEAREKAYAPYSNFYVGCSVLLEDGTISTGNNQENAVFPVGNCAEQVALNWVGANFPNHQIKKIFIVGAPKNNQNIKAVPPCGVCRQTISEYEDKQKHAIEVYFGSISGEIYKVDSIKTMLPFTFNSDFL